MNRLTFVERMATINAKHIVKMCYVYGILVGKIGKQCGKHCLSTMPAAEQKYIKSLRQPLFPYQNHPDSSSYKLSIACASISFCSARVQIKMQRSANQCMKSLAI